MGSAHIGLIPKGCVRLRRSQRYSSSQCIGIAPRHALIAAQPPRNAIREEYGIGSKDA